MSKAAVDSQYDALRRDILSWAAATEKSLKLRLLQLGVRERQGGLIDKLHFQEKEKSGKIYALVLKLLREGIFIERGVGRGRPHGSAAAKKYAKKWLSVVLQNEIEVLADIIAKRYSDIVYEEVAINIPGIKTKRQ